MRVPDLDLLVEEAVVCEFGQAITERGILELLREYLGDKTNFPIGEVSALDVYNYISYICNYQSDKTLHTLVFTNLVRYYNQLGNSAEDIPAREGKEAYTSLYVNGILEAIDYIRARTRSDV